MRCLNKVLRTAHSQGRDWRKQLNAYLRDYRATPHSMTGVPPGELMFNRSFRIRLPEFVDTENNNKCDRLSKAKAADQRNKAKIKYYGDRHNHAKRREWKLGSKVLVKQQKENKFTTFYEAEPYTVVGINGSAITAKRDSDGRIVMRNSSHYKQIKVPVKMSQSVDEQDDDSASIMSAGRSPVSQQSSSRSPDPAPRDSPVHGPVQHKSQPTQREQSSPTVSTQRRQPQIAEDRYHLRTDRQRSTRLADYYVFCLICE